MRSLRPETHTHTHLLHYSMWGVFISHTVYVFIYLSVWSLHVPSQHCRSSVCSTYPSDYVRLMSPLLPAIIPPREMINQAHIMQTPQAGSSSSLSCGP